jgi:hypothetical protein
MTKVEEKNLRLEIEDHELEISQLRDRVRALVAERDLLRSQVELLKAEVLVSRLSE